MTGNIVPILSPVEPEYGDGDGGAPTLLTCPECENPHYCLLEINEETGEGVLICSDPTCAAEMAYTIKPDE